MEQKDTSEKRTAFAVAFTLIVMTAELFAGRLTNSMALTADGIHMGTHVLVLGMNWAALELVRRLRKRHNISYDRNRILWLSAWTSGVFLFLAALFIIMETIERMTGDNAGIASGQAVVIAVIGLATNVVCAMTLHNHHADLSSHAAYLHILADVMTDIGTIAGLLCAMIWDITFIDSLVAVAAAVIVVRWAVKLLMKTGRLLTKADGNE